MDHAATFARHFARLLWLLGNEPQNITEQKAALRALVTVSRDGPVTLAAADGPVTSNGQPVPPVPGVAELASQLAAHQMRELRVQPAAAPADLLAAARLLAETPAAGQSADERLRQGGATTVHLIPSAKAATFDAFELVADDLLAVPEPTRPARSSGTFAADDSAAGGGGLFDQFAAAATGGDHAEQLLQQLERAQGAGDVLPALERITLAVDAAQNRSDIATLATLLCGVIDREAGAPEPTRRQYGLMIRRMVTAHTLRMVAGALPRRTVPKEQIGVVLTRAGEDGADALIEHLTQAEAATDRRAYYDMLLTLRAGVPALLQMLDDQRWYVVRNAADLLGEMKVAEAEKPLLALVDHEDERVQRSVITALIRLDTPAGRAAVRSAFQSPSAVTRQQAALALGGRRDPAVAPMLLRALETEEDDSVQRALLTALGQVGTDETVARLVKAAEPAGSLFRRKPTPLRVAAVSALGEARTPAALDALRTFVNDKEKEVRDAALKAISSARRSESRPAGGFAKNGE